MAFVRRQRRSSVGAPEAPGNGSQSHVRRCRPGEELYLFFIRRRGAWNQLAGRKARDIPHDMPPKSVADAATSRAPTPALEHVAAGFPFWSKLRAKAVPNPHQVSEVLSLLSID